MARVLIVDDEESDRLLESAILEQAGHEVVIVAGGDDALRAYLGQGVDVVITDLQMPDVHGFELITILRQLTPTPAIIAVSGTGQYQLHMAEALGAHTTLSKPIEADLLLDAVERAVAARA